MAITLTKIKIVLSALGGYIAYLLGGYDLALSTMLSLTIIDFITGVGVALTLGQFKANRCAQGIIKKVFIYITVALGVVVQKFIGDSIPLRETVIIFYIVSEGLSCLENIGKVAPYPEALKKALAQLNEGKNE